MACGRKPDCGSAGAVAGSTVSTIPADISWSIGIVSGVGSIVAYVSKASSMAILTYFGISAVALVWLAAVAAAAITIFAVFDFWRVRCLAHPDTQSACSAGVIERIVPSFGSASDELFPFSAMHDRIDVVVKCRYWFRVENAAAFVFCNTDPDESPILRGYYHNAKVCAAGAGSTIGAVVGGVAGVFLGALAGGAIASLACGPFAWLCLILAVIVAAVIAAVCVLVGALAGGQIGKWAASDPGATADDGSVLVVGDYVTTKGGLLTSGDDQGARVYWFVDTTTLHGRSLLSPPFSHTDPDDPVTGLTIDACPSPRIGA